MVNAEQTELLSSGEDSTSVSEQMFDEVEPHPEMPTLVVLGLDNIPHSLTQMQEELELVFDEKETLSTLLGLIQKEDTAEEDLEYWCMKMLGEHTELMVEEEVEIFIRFLLDLGLAIYTNAKMHGLYRDGRLDYLFDSIRHNSILIRRRASFYNALKREFSKIT